MALKGTLGDFSIAEIFQLIGQQQKTGVLSVTHDSAAVHVIFDGGRIVGAAEGNHGEDDRLIDRLQRMSILSPDDLRELKAARTGSVVDIADFLTQRGALSREDIAHLLGLEIHNTLLNLFLWSDGRYEFTPRKVRFDSEFTPGVPAEELLLDGLRAKDEWASIERKLPTFSAVPVQIEGAMDDISELGEGDIELGVYALVDGNSSVRAIIDRTRLSDFEACRILANLVSRGYIRVVSRVPDARTAHWRERVPPTAVAACAAAVILCGLLVGTFAGSLSGRAGEDRVPALRGPDARYVFAHNARARLRAALELYRVENGAYPDHLKALAEAGLVSQRDAGSPLFYEAQGDRYALLMSPR
ncbi:MAG: DUF4388 domain-containing protein [Deltaproteobacteria bacterium]|nr:DUF4388 domain-containing protein [Deltaproteobacteria bacterium]